MPTIERPYRFSSWLEFYFCFLWSELVFGSIITTSHILTTHLCLEFGSGTPCTISSTGWRLERLSCWVITWGSPQPLQSEFTNCLRRSPTLVSTSKQDTAEPKRFY